MKTSTFLPTTIILLVIHLTMYYKNSNDQNISIPRTRSFRLNLTQSVDETPNQEEYHRQGLGRVFPLQAPRAIGSALTAFGFDLPESPICIFDFPAKS